MLQDMTVEVQKALITRQNANCLKEDKGSPVAISQICSSQICSYKVWLISAQTDSRS